MKKPETYKVKRLRDGAVLDLKPPHALKLLRLNAQLSKSEFELAEKNYNFSDNEIHRATNVRDTESTETQSED